MFPVLKRLFALFSISRLMRDIMHIWGNGDSDWGGLAEEWPAVGRFVHLALPKLTWAWQTSLPTPFDISQEYFPAAAGRSLYRTSREQVESVVRTLYWYDAQINLSSFFQVTWTLWLPVYLHTSFRGWPTLKLVSSNFLVKQTGSMRSSERSKVSYILMSSVALVSINPETTTVWNGLVLSGNAVLSHKEIHWHASHHLLRVVHMNVGIF